MIIDEKNVLMTNINTWKEEKTKECDFREMAKVLEAKRGKVKRLQAGPKDKKVKEEFRKKTGTVLTKIVLRIQEMLPEIQMEKAGKIFTKHTSNMDRDSSKNVRTRWTLLTWRSKNQMCAR